MAACDMPMIHYPLSAEMLATTDEFLEPNEARTGRIVGWGDGSPARESLYVEDAARAIVTSIERCANFEPMNIGSGNEIAIKELVDLLAAVTGFEGEIRWDTGRSNGRSRPCLNASRVRQVVEWQTLTGFPSGPRATVETWRILSLNSTQDGREMLLRRQRESTTFPGAAPKHWTRQVSLAL